MIINILNLLNVLFVTKLTKFANNIFFRQILIFFSIAFDQLFFSKNSSYIDFDRQNEQSIKFVFEKQLKILILSQSTCFS